MSIQSNINQALSTSTVVAGLADKLLSDKLGEVQQGVEGNIEKESANLRSTVAKRVVEEQTMTKSEQEMKQAQSQIDQAQANIGKSKLQLALYPDKRTKQNKQFQQDLSKSEQDLTAAQESLVKSTKSYNNAGIAMKAQLEAESQIEARLSQQYEFKGLLEKARKGGLIQKFKVMKQGGKK